MSRHANKNPMISWFFNNKSLWSCTTDRCPYEVACTGITTLEGFAWRSWRVETQKNQYAPKISKRIGQHQRLPKQTNTTVQKTRHRAFSNERILPDVPYLPSTCSDHQIHRGHAFIYQYTRQTNSKFTTVSQTPRSESAQRPSKLSSLNAEQTIKIIRHGVLKPQSMQNRPSFFLFQILMADSPKCNIHVITVPRHLFILLEKQFL